jgi:hypothetical protein
MVESMLSASLASRSAMMYRSPLRAVMMDPSRARECQKKPGRGSRYGGGHSLGTIPHVESCDLVRCGM